MIEMEKELMDLWTVLFDDRVSIAFGTLVRREKV